MRSSSNAGHSFVLEQPKLANHVSPAFFRKLTGISLPELIDKRYHAHVVKVDRAFASKILDVTLQKDMQRKLRDSHVRDLTNVIEMGGFSDLPTPDAIGITVYQQADGTYTPVLSNSQHRLTALKSSDLDDNETQEFPMAVVVVVAENSLKARSYFGILDNGKVRSDLDKNRTTGVDILIKDAADETWEKSLTPAMKLVANNLMRAKLSPAVDMVALYNEYADSISIFYTQVNSNVVRAKPGSPDRAIKDWSNAMRRAPFLSTMIFFIEHNQNEAVQLLQLLKRRAISVQPSTDAHVEDIFRLVMDAELGSQTSRDKALDDMVKLIAIWRGKTAVRITNPMWRTATLME